MRMPRPVFVLAIIAFLVALGFGIVSPVLPLFARTFGVSTLAAGAVASSFALVRVASLPLAAKLTRRLAERRVIVAGVLIVAVSSARCAAATSYWQFLIARAPGWQSNGVRSLVVPLLVVETLAKPASWSAWAFGAAAAAQALTLYGSGWISDRVGRRIALVTGSVVTALLGLAFIAPASYTVLVVVLCLYGC